MADLTVRGRTSVEPSAELKRRKLELQQHSIRGEILRNEVEIMDMENTIQAKQTNIAALEEQYAELQKALDDDMTDADDG